MGGHFHWLFFIINFWVLSVNPVAAQYLSNADTVYIPEVVSVTFHPVGQELAFPLIHLQSRRPLVLSFDDHRGGFTDLKYKIVHCDAQWRPSDLNPFEFIDGFPEERLRNYEFSLNTYEEYTNYMLTIPNDSMDVKLSGNFLLHVFEDNLEQTPVLTRRFLVAEGLFGIRPTNRTPSVAAKYRTHQEFDVSVSYKDIRVVNPLREINMTVLQNGRWDNALLNLVPQSVRNEEVVYDFPDKIVFPAGKEFRFVDIRNTRFKTQSIKRIVELKNGIDIFLHEDQSRLLIQYQNFPDANGRWVVDNRERRNERSESEYLLVHFTLEESAIPGRDVYIMGGLTDWRLNPRFRMEFDPEANVYRASVMLKQGYYDYCYAVTADGRTFNTEVLEGNWSETGNEYLFLVYYRPFGERYDRLAGVSSFITGRQP